MSRAGITEEYVNECAWSKKFVTTQSCAVVHSHYPCVRRQDGYLVILFIYKYRYLLSYANRQFLFRDNGFSQITILKDVRCLNTPYTFDVTWWNYVTLMTFAVWTGLVVLKNNNIVLIFQCWAKPKCWTCLLQRKTSIWQMTYLHLCF